MSALQIKSSTYNYDLIRLRWIKLPNNKVIINLAPYWKAAALKEIKQHTNVPVILHNDYILCSFI